MLITPRVSEKSYKLVASNVYVFDVPLTANKTEVIAAIERQYDGVKINDVRLMITKGKSKSVNRGKRARPTTANRRDTKKDYVTVAEGKIEIAAFSEIDNQAQTSQVEQTKVKTDTRASENTESKKANLLTRRRTGKRGDK